MPQLPLAPSSAASPHRDRVLFWSQVVISCVILTASLVQLFTQWSGSADGGPWSGITAVLAIAMLMVIATTAHNRRTMQNDLAHTTDELSAAVTTITEGDEALRVSELSNESSEQLLNESIALNQLGEEKLHLAEVKGIEGAEALRVSVADGIEGAEALRVSVASGIEGAEALRVSVADGIEGAEALRISIEQGIDAASTTLAVVDTVDAAITLYAPDGHVLLTNDTARALAVLARSGELDPHEFGDDRVTLIPRFDQVLARAARGQLVTRRAYWVGTGDEQRAIMSTSQYVKRASGELIGTVVASHDVTPLARTRDEFLETVSHELRTPLTSMIGYLELIEDSLDLTEAGIAQEFEVLQRNTDRLLKLINDLLLTAKGELPTDKRPFDVVALATKSVHALQRHADEREVTLIVADSPPVIAEIDADQISDVLDKILSNALKFNRPGGQIELTFRANEKLAVITVADTGIGISVEDQKRMFERFYRAPSIRSDLIAGVGLGLSAAKLIIEAHHGFIAAVSAPGVGTTIEISLPLIAISSSAAPSHPALL